MLAAGCGGGGGGGRLPTATSLSETVTIQGRVNVPPEADPTFFASRSAGKLGSDDYQYIPLTGAAVTIAGSNAAATTDTNGAFSLTLTYHASPYPVKITVTKGNIVLKKYVTQAAASLPVQVTTATTAAALAYDKLNSQGNVIDIDDLEQRIYSVYAQPANSIRWALDNYLSSGNVTTLTSPITQQNDVLSKVNVLTDVSAPQLDVLELSETSVVPGENITATIRVKEKTGMASSQFTLYFQDDSIQSAELTNWTYNSASDTWSSSVTFAIPNYSESGNYFIVLYLADSLYNRTYYSSTQDEYHVPTTWSPYELTSKITPIVVSSGASDTTAPTLVSITAPDANVTASDDTAVLRVTAADSQSAMKQAFVQLRLNNSQVSSSGACTPGATPGQYVCDITFSPYQFSVTGTYSIYLLELQDNVSNYNHYRSSSLQSAPTISISFTQGNSAGTVQVSNATFSSNTVSAGHKASFSINVNFDSKPNNVHVYYSKDGSSDSNGYIQFILSTTGTSTSGPWVFSGTETVNPYVQPGTYKASYFSVSSYNYTNSSWKEKSYSRYNSGDIAFLDSLPTLTVTNDWKPDNQSPSLVSMELDGAAFQRGGKIKGSITVSDNTYISSISIYLIHQTSTSANASFSFSTYNCYPGATEGRWMCKFEETLPANLATGAWSVYSVEAADLAQNSFYDTNINTTFTIN